MSSSFPFVFIINMKERTERKAKMEILMKEIGITEYEFILPIEITEETIPEEYLKNRMNKGNTSLNLTILTKIFPKARQMYSRDFIVMEDDLMVLLPKTDVKNHILRILREEVPEDWNMIYLEYCLEMCSLAKSIDNKNKNKKIKKAFHPYCAAAILFRYDTMNLVYKCIDTKKNPLSFTYSSCIYNKELIAYISDPPIFAQDVLMQGDIAHTASPWNIHFYLNRILKMYDTEATVSKPRLPACIDSTATLEYIRWWNIGWILMSIAFLFGVYKYRRYIFFVGKNGRK
jgi:hypothetical protein